MPVHRLPAGKAVAWRLPMCSVDVTCPSDLAVVPTENLVRIEIVDDIGSD